MGSWDVRVTTTPITPADLAAVRSHIRERIQAVLDIPVGHLAQVMYGDEGCTSWEEIVAEDEEADEDEKPTTTYRMLCESAERVRAAILLALAGGAT